MFYEYVAEEYEVDGVPVKIIADQDAPDPRKEWHHIATMVCCHRDYVLGDEQISPYSEYIPGPKEWIAKEEGFDLFCKECDGEMYDENHHDDEESECEGDGVYFKEKVFILPLYLMDHSGISMSTSNSMFRAFDSAGWDWGCVGFIYVTEAKAKAELIAGEATDEEVEAAAIRCMVSEVTEYDQYLTGDVWGYVVNDDESCWGYFGIESCKEDANAVARSIAEDIAEKLVPELSD